MAIVHLCVVLAQAPGQGRLAHLRLDRPIPPVLARNSVLWRGTGLNAAASAVEAHAIGALVVADLVPVSVMDNVCVDVNDGDVVGEGITHPAAAVIAIAGIAVAVVHPAVEAHFGSPVAVVPYIVAVVPGPVAGGPEQPFGGGLHPGARNPVVAVVAPSPVAGGPDKVRLGARRLVIDGQRRRRNVDGNGD